MSRSTNLRVREGPPTPDEQLAREREERRQQKLELALALLPLLAIGAGCALIYPPAGLVVPGLLAWWDNRDPPPPPPKPRQE